MIFIVCGHYKKDILVFHNSHPHIYKSIFASVNMLYLKRSVMERIDRHATERVSLERMVPLAGRRLAEFISKRRSLEFEKGITLLMGRGPNGGGGLFALSCLLEKAGSKARASIMPAWNFKESPHSICFVNQKLKAIMADKRVENRMLGEGIVIDALLGYKLSSPPKRKYRRLISIANNSGLPVVSLDVASGLNTETGKFYDSRIKASCVLCLDVAKHGLRQISGIVYVADLGFEQSDYERFGIRYPRPFLPGRRIEKAE